VAVVDRPDELMGHVGAAVVVPLDPGAPPTLAELRVHAADRIARHELPEHLVVVEALPRTPMEKLDRAGLRRLVARG
jgi:acyl-coenzyme A synthetase/AMP-(fatty) acid ligase